MNTPLPTNIELTFHILQNGKEVSKKVLVNRNVFLQFNARGYKKFAQLYDAIVKEKAYIRIEDNDPASN